jgi:hypothetical protein
VRGVMALSTYKLLTSQSRDRDASSRISPIKLPDIRTPTDGLLCATFAYNPLINIIYKLVAVIRLNKFAYSSMGAKALVLDFP